MSGKIGAPLPGHFGRKERLTAAENVLNWLDPGDYSSTEVDPFDINEYAAESAYNDHNLMYYCNSIVILPIDMFIKGLGYVNYYFYHWIESSAWAFFVMASV